MSDSPSDSCAALNLINAAVFCDCALTKTGLMDSRLLSAASSGSVKRVGLTSLRRSILKDLIPQGRKQRYVRKKGKKKDKMFSLFSTARWFYRFFSSFFFFDLPTMLGNEEDQFRSAAPHLAHSHQRSHCHSCPIPAAAAATAASAALGCARSIFLPAIPI